MFVFIYSKENVVLEIKKLKVVMDIVIYVLKKGGEGLNVVVFLVFYSFKMLIVELFIKILGILYIVINLLMERKDIEFCLFYIIEGLRKVVKVLDVYFIRKDVIILGEDKIV